MRFALGNILGVYAPYLSFTLAVTIAALVGGRGPGVAAAALSTAAASWLFLKPVGSLIPESPEAAWALGLFTLSALLIALLVGSLRAALGARAKTEEALRRQARLIDLSHDAIISMDRGRRILAWNQGAEEIYGWREHEAVGKVLHELLHTECAAPPEELAAILQREGRWEGEMCQTARDGRHLIIESRQVLLGSGIGAPECLLAINRDITARKRSNDALRASEARLQFVLDAAKLGTWDLDLETRVAWHSPQHDAIFGYASAPRDWTYQTFLEHVVPEHRESVDRIVREAVAGGADVEHECRIRTADGEVRWIWALGRVQRGSEGQPQRLTGVVRDVTARREIQEDLRQSEEQFRTLANTIPQMCGIANPDGWFSWANRRWCEYTGLTPEQTAGWGWLSAVDREASTQALELWRQSIAAGEPFESVFAVRGADGLTRPFLGMAMPMRDRGGKVVRWFATMTDISEQRKTEDALRKAHAEELARGAELQAIMDAVPVAIFITHDPECRSLLGNRAAYRLLREPPGSNLSQSAFASDGPAFRFVDDGREIPYQELPLQQAASTGEAVNDHELEVAFTDGSRASMIGKAVPLLDGQGRATGAIGVFVDITERKQTEERLRQAQKLESVGLLAGGIAHDFNNLLTVILGNADLARTQCPACEPVRQIVTSSERAAHLTRQLLAYAGKGQFITETFALTDLVSRCRELLSASVPKHVKMIYRLSDEEAPIKADPSQIEQVLVNLVANAGEAIPPQTDGWIEIATTACEVPAEMLRPHGPTYDARPGPFVCLDVADNGSGMDEATLVQIFSPFFSTRFTGRGLGLAAVQGIVRSCHGFIEVKSSPGAGSRFRVFLPAAAKKPATAEPAARTDAGPEEAGHVPATILVADDEELLRQLACAALRDAGYEVLEAEDGPHALEMLAGAARPPSLALLDWSMPGMEADELVATLNRKYPRMRIIMSSGYPEEELRRSFPPGAVAGFLEKPYSVAMLRQKVEETLRSGGGPAEEYPAVA
jgi:PAS domain S-box-containing protein